MQYAYKFGVPLESAPRGTESELGAFTAVSWRPSAGYRYEWASDWQPQQADWPPSIDPPRTGGPWLVLTGKSMNGGAVRFSSLAQPTFPLRRSEKAKVLDDAVNEAPDIHRDFAKLVTVRDGVVEARPERLLAFANEHGSLGIPNVRLTRPAADGTIARQAGESWGDWLNEAATVTELLDVWGLVQRGDRVGLQQRITQAKEAPDGSYALPGGLDAVAGTYVRRARAVRLNRDVEWVAIATEDDDRPPMFKKQLGDPVWAAHWWLALEINRHMAGSATDGLQATVSAALLPTKLGQPLAFDIRIRPQTLLGAIYCALAVEVSGAAARSRRQCPACGKTFTPGRRDQVYCGPSCRSLAKYHRDRHAAKQSLQHHQEES